MCIMVRCSGGGGVAGDDGGRGSFFHSGRFVGMGMFC